MQKYLFVGMIMGMLIMVFAAQTWLVNACVVVWGVCLYYVGWLVGCEDKDDDKGKHIYGGYGEAISKHGWTPPHPRDHARPIDKPPTNSVES